MFDWLRKKVVGEEQPYLSNEMLRFGSKAAYRNDAAPARQTKKLCKVVMVGESGSGKSAFVTRVTSNRFNNQYCCTIGADFACKTITVAGEEVTLQIWDTAGQERFQSLSGMFYRGASGFFLVADTSKPSCIERLEDWLLEIGKHGVEGCPIVLLGTKADISSGMEPALAAFAKERGLLFTICSAKTAEGVEDAVTILTLAMMGHSTTAEVSFAARKKAERDRRAVTDLNIFNVNVTGLGKAAPIVTGDPCICTNCGVLVSSLSTVSPGNRRSAATAGEALPCIRAPVITAEFGFVEEGAGHCEDLVNGDFRTWDCEFCGKRNFLEIDTDEIPSSPVVDYVVHGAAAGDKDTPKNVIFCLDVSGSMCVTTEVRGAHNLKGYARQRAAREKISRDLGVAMGDQFAPGQLRNATMVSRLQCVQQAIEEQVERLSREEPTTRVGLVTFNSEVTVVGDGSAAPMTVAGDRLGNWEELEALGHTLSLESSVTDSKERLLEKLWDIEETGGTALGPGLLLAICMAGKQPGSHVVLCTDGKANVGIGSLDRMNDDEMDLTYTQLAELAKVLGVVVSVVSIIGSECKLDHVGVVATETRGNVERVDPVDLVKNAGKLGCLVNKPIIAYGTMAMVILHRALQFNGEMEDENEMEDESKNRNFLVKDLGTVNEDTELPISYGFRSRKGRDFKKFTKVPFQAQLLYTRPDGTKLLRVATAQLDVTTDQSTAKKAQSGGLLAAQGVRRAAALAKAGQLGDARAEIQRANVHLHEAQYEAHLHSDIQELNEIFADLSTALESELERCETLDQLPMLSDQLDATSAVFMRAAKHKSRFW